MRYNCKYKMKSQFYIIVSLMFYFVAGQTDKTWRDDGSNGSGNGLVDCGGGCAGKNLRFSNFTYFFNYR